MKEEEIILKTKWYIHIQTMVAGVLLFLLLQWIVNHVFGMPETYIDIKYRSMLVWVMWMVPAFFAFLILRGKFQYHIFTPTGIFLVRFNKIVDNKIYSWKELRILKVSHQSIPESAKNSGVFICLNGKSPFKIFNIEMLSFCELNSTQTNHLSAAKLMYENGKDGLSDQSLTNLQEYIEFYEKKGKGKCK